MARKKSLARSAFDCKHVKSVSCWALLWRGELAGKIVADWSDNPAGSVCTCTVVIYAGPLAELEKATGNAGGSGYDKLSAAFVSAMGRSNLCDLVSAEVENGLRKVHSAGEAPMRKWLESLGYTVHVLL